MDTKRSDSGGYGAGDRTDPVGATLDSPRTAKLASLCACLEQIDVRPAESVRSLMARSGKDV